MNELRCGHTNHKGILCNRLFGIDKVGNTTVFDSTSLVNSQEILGKIEIKCTSCKRHSIIIVEE